MGIADLDGLARIHFKLQPQPVELFQSPWTRRPSAGLALIRVHFEHGFEDYDRQVKQKHGNILHAKPTRGAPCSFPNKTAEALERFCRLSGYLVFFD
jgi:hypothetical protein